MTPIRRFVAVAMFGTLAFVAGAQENGPVKKGTPERFAYLHALSSNPAVLAEQTV